MATEEVMKLVIQIPAWNEAESLPRVLAELPPRVPGFESVEALVVDDGSADRTSEVAREAGFQDPLYFSRQFRRRFGASPRQYRRR